MFKKQKKNDYNWTFEYIKEYNQMISKYEKKIKEQNEIIKEKESIIKLLKDENIKLKSSSTLKPRQKQISDTDITKIKELKREGKSYSYIANVTGWSKATISRVINNII